MARKTPNLLSFMQIHMKVLSCSSLFMQTGLCMEGQKTCPEHSIHLHIYANGTVLKSNVYGMSATLDAMILLVQ